MKKISVLTGVLATLSAAHYSFPNLIYNGITSKDWEYVRKTASDNPVQNAESAAIRCYEDHGRKTSGIATIAAGSKVGFKASNSMGHPGPFTFYMAQAPNSVSVANWDGSGPVWFKIDELGAKVDSSGVHFTLNLNAISTTIPKSIPAGEYLLRVEHIGLHVAGKPQFYPACAQLRVTGGGSGSPSPKVSFPGAYKVSSPSFTSDIWKGSKPYPMPGPPVWKG